MEINESLNTSIHFFVSKVIKVTAVHMNANTQYIGRQQCGADTTVRVIMSFSVLSKDLLLFPTKTHY